MASLVYVLTLQFVGKDDVRYTDHGSDKKYLNNAVADFIVGTGSGGATVARRLAEVDCKDVLSIEAGETPPLQSEVVKLFTTMIRTEFDWQFFSQEKRACKAQYDKKCFHPRGKGIGGCPMLNVMFYVRGARIVYDRWKEKHGCAGWGFSDVLPYFKKAERNLFDWNDPKYHADCGPLCISHYDQTSPSMFLFEKAGNEEGIPTIADINSGYQGPGFVTTQGTQCNGRRSSVAKAYINPIMNKKNYRLIQKAIVTKIIIKDKKAIGVEFVRDGKTYTARARKEVILSAGAIGSPTVLLLSGVGPKDMLKKNRIPVVHPLPKVGMELADHVLCWLWYAFREIKTTTSLVQLGEIILQYYRPPRTGIFSGIGTLGSVSFTSIDVDGDAIFQTFHFFFEKNSLDLPEVLRVAGYVNEVNQAILAANSESAVALIIPTLLEPDSRGVVGLQGLTGTDAVLKPYMAFGYFSDSNNHDRQRLIKAIKYQISFEATKTYIEAGGALIPTPYCFQYDYGSDEFCDCYIDYYGATIYHPVGTCRMGTDPSNSVVNTKGEVHGIARLRVVDASVMPEITHGNTNAPTIMIGEKMADLIKKDYGKDTVKAGVCPFECPIRCRSSSSSSSTSSSSTSSSSSSSSSRRKHGKKRANKC